VLNHDDGSQTLLDKWAALVKMCAGNNNRAIQVYNLAIVLPRVH